MQIGSTQLVTLTYGTPRLIHTACAHLAEGTDIGIAFTGVRARLLGLALPVVRFLSARSHDPEGGDEPRAIVFVRGVVILGTALMPFTRILIAALTRKRQLGFRATEGGLVVSIEVGSP